MKLIAACVAVVALVAAIGNSVQFAAAAVAAAGSAAAQPAVGLYAPDRYDGIPEMCLMPMDFGYCRAKVKRYYFDMRRMKCAMFYWGGCAGNINNFKSLDECNKVCLDDSYYEEVNSNSNNRNYLSSSSSNNNNQNVKSNNLNNFKPNSNYKSEQRRIGVGAKINDNSNNRNDNFDGHDDEEDYQQ